MDHQEFNKLFDDVFAQKLIATGFVFVRKTKTLRYQSGTRDLWIKRVTGKWPHPGVSRTAICFRHNFLRPVSCDDPNSTNLIVDDFPRKLRFEDFGGWQKPDLRYRPKHSGRWVTTDLAYGTQSPRRVTKRLQKMANLVGTRVLPWVNSIIEESELSQIVRYGEQAWCEERWIDDYKASQP